MIGDVIMRLLTGLLLSSLWLAFTGCASSEVVNLKHPSKGDVVKCGPYTVSGNIAAAAETAQNELRYCVSDFQRQGYERIAH
jgi:hypothetical protein